MKAQKPEEKLFILDLLKLNKSIKIDDKVFYPEESVINIIKQVLNRPAEPAKGLTDEEIEEKYPTKIADIEKMLKMEKKSYSKNIYDYILSIAESNKQYQAIAKWARSRMQGLIQHGESFKCPECGKEIQFGLSKEGQKLFYNSRLFKDHQMPSYLKEDRPEIICTIGSSRFAELEAVKKWELEKKGNICIGMHLLPQWYTEQMGWKESHHGAEQENIAEIMDALHLKKIEMADEIFVINFHGYIGKRTQFEIDYATKLGKPIRYLEPFD